MTRGAVDAPGRPSPDRRLRVLALHIAFSSSREAAERIYLFDAHVVGLDESVHEAHLGAPVPYGELVTICCSGKLLAGQELKKRAAHRLRGAQTSSESPMSKLGEVLLNVADLVEPEASSAREFSE